MNQRNLPTICLFILTGIVLCVALQQGKTIFAPVLSALLLGVILTPLSDFWDRLRFPPALSAALSVLLALLIILTLLLLLEPYVTDVINRAPLIWEELRSTVEELRRTLRGVEKIAEDVAAAIETDAGAGGSADGDAVALPSITEALFFAPQFAAQCLIFAGTLYFFLMVKNDLYAWVSAASFKLGEGDLRMAGQQVSRYVLTISAINLGLGVIVMIVMELLGMPSPVLWGLLAFALNFLLYLGPMAMISMLTVTGIVVFDGPTSFMPALIYFVLNATEAQFVTPMMVGRSLSVNPLTVFLSLVFWMWLWGPIGGIIAIPLLIWCITILKCLPSAPLAEEQAEASQA
ncbi:AI-2E family transporter [Alphaproteobacteria bacterium KMM 3653]|uniref:AI-2E family transporter n=1 Tax=Harenicola maris TaxID=2841044 RepID=A0AAP2CRD2_9RHOB|nr:AI-2E family transporter [Harenicola maris]